MVYMAVGGAHDIWSRSCNSVFFVGACSLAVASITVNCIPFCYGVFEYVASVVHHSLPNRALEEGVRSRQELFQKHFT